MAALTLILPGNVYGAAGTPGLYDHIRAASALRFGHVSGHPSFFYLQLILPKTLPNSSTALDSFVNIWYYNTMMKAELIYYDKVIEEPNSIVELTVWSIPKTSDKPHGYKYSLVFVKAGKRIVGYDNAEGKGDHVIMAIGKNLTNLRA
ncbi:MAG: DUF6516 family protein [Candidatus Jettenia sp. CY-1]|nr:DUF6516 family protein [Candidatus Jettenia sp.]WKZ17512.1 MAG: DUF6516 family protein [Candidatus Jettenia sp. CY-1]